MCVNKYEEAAIEAVYDQEKRQQKSIVSRKGKSFSPLLEFDVFFPFNVR